MTDQDKMMFGKHKGEKMEDVPASYLDWLIDQSWIDSWPAIKRYIEKNLEVIHMEMEER